MNKKYVKDLDLPTFFWWTIKDNSIVLIKKNFKRYLPFSLISAFFFLLTTLVYIPVFFFPTNIEVVLTCSVLSIIFFIFLTYPSLYIGGDVPFIDSTFEAYGKKFLTLKHLMKRYISVWHDYIMKIFTGGFRSWAVIFRSLIAFIILFILVIIPSYLIKNAAEPQYFSIFTTIGNQFMSNNPYAGFATILSIQKEMYIEFSIFYSLVYLTIVVILAFHAFYVKARQVGFPIELPNRIANKIYKLVVRQEKWSFAMYFTNYFKFEALIFALLFGGLEALFVYLFKDPIMATSITAAITGVVLCLYSPLFLFIISTTTVTFNDMYAKGLFDFKNEEYKKETGKERDLTTDEMYENIYVNRKELYQIAKDYARNKKHGIDLEKDIQQMMAEDKDQSQNNNSDESLNNEEIFEDDKYNFDESDIFVPFEEDDYDDDYSDY